MKAAISNSLFPAFGSLMHNVGFRNPDNVFHEPHFMCGLVGPFLQDKIHLPRFWNGKSLHAIARGGWGEHYMRLLELEEVALLVDA